MKFKVLIADPPWKYASSGPVGNGGRGDTNIENIIQVDVANHYPTMTQEEMLQLPVVDSLDTNALLFLWTTNLFLANGTASTLAKAWGFEPVTILTWAKTKKDTEDIPSMKTGHWFRGASEHVIFGTRGKTKRPEGYPAIATWFPHQRLGHSVKPEILYDIVEKCSSGPYLELFARRILDRPNWFFWGNEIESTYSLGQRGQT